MGWGRVPTPPEAGDVEQELENKLAAWLWLRAELSWQLDDHYTTEMFRAAQACCSMSADYITRAEYRVGNTIYFLEPK